MAALLDPRSCKTGLSESVLSTNGSFHTLSSREFGTAELGLGEQVCVAEGPGRQQGGRQECQHCHSQDARTALSPRRLGNSVTGAYGMTAYRDRRRGVATRAANMVRMLAENAEI